MIDVSMTVVYDGATPLLRDLQRISEDPEVRAGALAACINLTRSYLLTMPPNSRGWPSLGFWKGAADGTTGELSKDGFHVLIDNEDAPGAMKFKYYCHVYGSGTIEMKDKLLTIPARQEFYGHRAGEFDNLRFVKFASGAKALVIGKGGTSIVDFGTGQGKAVRGAGARTAAMVAYWLVESVTQRQEQRPVPTNEDYLETVKNVYLAAYAQLKNGSN